MCTPGYMSYTYQHLMGIESQQSDVKLRVLLASECAYNVFTAETTEKPATQAMDLTPEQDERIYRTLVQAFQAFELRKQAMKQNVPIPIIPAENEDQHNQPTATTLLRPTIYRIEYYEPPTLDARNSALPIFERPVVPAVGISNPFHNSFTRRPTQAPPPKPQPIQHNPQGLNPMQNTLTTSTFRKIAPAPSYTRPIIPALVLPPSRPISRHIAPRQIAPRPIAPAPHPDPPNPAIPLPWTPIISRPITLPLGNRRGAAATARKRKRFQLAPRPAPQPAPNPAVPSFHVSLPKPDRVLVYNDKFGYQSMLPLTGQKTATATQSAARELQPAVQGLGFKVVPTSNESESKNSSPVISSRVRKNKSEKNGGMKANMVQSTLLKDGSLAWGLGRRKKKDFAPGQAIFRKIKQEESD